jgi:CBS domain containing-hemolysin-like protein
MTALLAAFGLLLLASAFFSASEIAVTMASRVRLRTRAETGSRRARVAERLLRHPERALVTCLVGNNLVQIATGIVSRVAVMTALATGETMSDLLATLITLPLLLVCGEVAPKALAQTYPNRILTLLAVPLDAIRFVLWPLAAVCFGIAGAVRRLLGVQSGVLDFVSREEFKQLIAQSEKRGHVDPEERALIDRILEFETLDPRQLARPLRDVPQLRESATAGAAKRLMRDARLGRLAVTQANGSEIVGVVSASGLLEAPNEARLAAYLLPPVHLRADAGADRLLAELQRSPSQMAVVAHPDGAFGVITLDDLLAHLLGKSAPARRHWLRVQAG